MVNVKLESERRGNASTNTKFSVCSVFACLLNKPLIRYNSRLGQHNFISMPAYYSRVKNIRHGRKTHQKISKFSTDEEIK